MKEKEKIFLRESFIASLYKFTMVTIELMGKFQEKLWCSGGWGITNIIFIESVDNAKWPAQRVSKADVPSVSPSSERIEELWVVCSLHAERWSYAFGENIGTFSCFKLNLLRLRRRREAFSGLL